MPRVFQFNIQISEYQVVRIINATSLYQVSKLVTTRLMDNNMIEKPPAIEEGTRQFKVIPTFFVTFFNERFLVYDLQSFFQFVRRNFLTCLLANDKVNLQRRILDLSSDFPSMHPSIDITEASGLVIGANHIHLLVARCFFFSPCASTLNYETLQPSSFLFSASAQLL